MPKLPQITPELVQQYQAEVGSNSSPATLKRKNISLNRFFDWAQKEGHLDQNPLITPVEPVIKEKPIKEKLIKRAAPTTSRVIRPINFVGFAFVGLSIVLLFLLINKLKLPIPFRFAPAQQTELTSIEPTTTQEGVAILSPWTIFAKLNLSDSQGAPLTTSQQISFKVYNSEDDSQALWTSPSQTVTPDADGNTLITLDDVPTKLFFENERLFLGVTTNDGELDQRIPVSTANVASNLQGYFPSLAGEPETVPVLSEDGELLLAAEAPAVKATNGNLLIQGQAVTLATADGSDGNIEINPDGSGKVSFLFEGAGGDFLRAQAPNLISGALFSGSVTNNTTDFDLIKLESGANPTTKFSVDATGNTEIAGVLNVGGEIQTNDVTRITSAGKLDNITGYEQDSGNMTITQSAGDGITVTKAESALTDLMNLHLNEDKKANSIYSTLVLKRTNGTREAMALWVDLGKAKFDDQVQLGRLETVPTEAIGEGTLYFNTSDDTLYLYNGTAWVALGGGTSSAFWQRISGVLSPITSTDDFAIGGTDATAPFFVDGATGNTTIDGSLDANADVSIADTDIAFDGASTTFTTTGDLTLTIGGGDLIFTDTNTINIGGNGQQLVYNIIGDNIDNVSAAVNSDDDLYIEGNLEVDGTIYGNVSGSITPSGFTEGSVVFADSGGSLAQDNANFFWDDTNDKLGLGTNAPGARLQINVPTTTTEALILKTTDDNATKNLLEVQNSGGTNLVNIAANGVFQVGGSDSNTSITANIIHTVHTTTYNAAIYETTGSAKNVRFLFRNPSQDWTMGLQGTSSDAFVLLDGNDVVFSALPGAGNNSLAIGATGGVTLNGFTAPTVGLTVKGASSQSANLQEWQDSSGTVLGVVDERGVPNFNAGTGVGNTFIGNDAGNTTMTGGANVAIGKDTLAAATSGGYNSVLGTSTLSSLTTGSSNAALGYASMLSVTTGNQNVAIGRDTLRAANVDADYNVAIGYQAGYNATDSNVFIGNQAGYNETGSNKLYIANSNTTTPLIYGLFTGTGAGVTINSQATDGVPLTVKGIASQASNLQEWQDSGGTVKASVNANGNFGIGITPTDTSKARIRLIQSTATSDSLKGVEMIMYLSGSGNMTNTLYGSTMEIQTDPALSGTLTDVTGVLGSTTHQSASTITTSRGFLASITNTSTGTISNAYGLDAWIRAGTGTITNAYGVYVRDINTASTLNYAILTNAGNIVFNEGGDASTDLRVEGDTDANLLFTDADADKVGVGTNSPSFKLHVSNANASNDTNIGMFRASAGSDVTLGSINFTAGLRPSATAGNRYGYINVGDNGNLRPLILNFNGTSVFANVGIGTTAPDARLEINHATGDNLRLTYDDSDGSASYYTDFSLSSAGDLTLDSAGGDIIFADDDVLNIGGNADDVAFNAIGDDTAGATNVDSDDDLYIEGNLEVDGTIYGAVSGTIDPGFTEGSVIFQGPSGLAQDNANFFWDDTDNQLGIGTNSPTAGYSLDVAGYINTAQTVNQNTYPSVNASQTASTLQDGSAYTGTDATMSTQYIAVKFTASGDHTMGNYTIRVKEDTDITNTTSYLTGYIYADDGGSPSKPTGSALATGKVIRFGTLTSSYQALSVGTTYTMTNGTAYWLVLKYSSAPTGGNIVLDSDVSSNMGATSTDGSSWTNTDARLWYQIRGETYYALYGQSTNYPAIYGISTTQAGVSGSSISGVGILGSSTNGIGVYGLSTNTYAIQGISTNSVGVYGLSTASYGLFGVSTSSYGVYGSSTSGVGTRGTSTSNVGVYGTSTDYYGIYGTSTTNRSGYFYRNSDTATTENFSVISDHTGDTQTVLSVRGDGSGDLINVFDGTDEVFTIEDGGDVGLGGDTSPDAKLEVLSTSEQLRLTHTDDTYDARFTVDGSGDLGIDVTGTKVSLTDDLEVVGSDITLGTAGVKLTGDGDGAITLLGLGDGEDEDLTFNLDDTADKVVLSSSTGVNEIQLSSLDILVGGGNINTGDIALTIGDGDTDSITLSTDGTGNAEVVLPNDSVGPTEIEDNGATPTDEYCLTYEATGEIFEWQECGVGGAGAWSAITDPTDDLNLTTMAAYNTTFTWDPTADSAETAFTMNFDGEDTVAGGDEDQVLLALIQTANGQDVDEAADALLTFTNSDADDPVNNGIRFDAGGAGTDFTYGINFDLATFGTAELILSNSATIENIADGTLALTEPTIKLVGSTSIDIDSPLIDLSTQTVAVTLNAAADALNFDSNTLSIDASADEVGIGDPDPDAKLEILHAGTQLLLSFDDGVDDASFAVDDDGYLIIDPSGARIALDGALQVSGTTPLAYSRLGSNTTDHSLDGADDLLITDDMELDGILYLDGLNIANAAGTSTIVFTATPTTTRNTLSASAWLVENTANVGETALQINQTKYGDLLTASASGIPRATIERSGDYRMYGPKSQVTIASINDAFVYDTTADYDGGSWTESEQAKASSWYNETVDAAGISCSISTDDRCGQQAFPKKAVIVADDSNVRIYNAEDQTMWMRFAQGSTALGADANNNPSTVFALNGKVYIGTNGSSATGLYVVDFKEDRIRRYNSTNRSLSEQNISSRNSANTFTAESTIMKLPSSVINDVKASRISGKDYFAVGTNGGSIGSASLIQEETGSTIHFGQTTATVASNNVFLTTDGTLYYSYRDQNSLAGDKLKVNYRAHLLGVADPTINARTNIPADIVYGHVSSTNYGITTGDASSVATAVSVPDLQPGPTFIDSSPVINDLFVTRGTSTTDNRSNTIYLGTSDGLVRIDEYQTDLNKVNYSGNVYTDYGYNFHEYKGAVKYYTKDYITESMYGDILGVWGLNNNSASDLEDLSIKGNNLTNNGSVTFSASGVRGNAATFSQGSSQSLSSTSTSLLPASTISVGAWVNPTTISGEDTIIAKSGDTTNKGYRLYLDAGVPTFEVSDNGTDVRSVASSNALATGNWYHVVGVFAPSDKNQRDGALRIYVNGLLVAQSSDAPNNIYYTPSVFYLGKDDQYPTNVTGTVSATTTIINVTNANTIFKKGDYINIRNTTAGSTTATFVTATSSTTITVLDSPGSDSDSVTIAKVNYRNSLFTSDTSATFKVHQGPSQEDFDIGDLVQAYDSTGTTLSTQTVVSAVSETTITTLAAVGNAITDDIYFVKLSTTRPVFGSALDVTFKIITMYNPDEFSVGDLVQVSSGANAAAAPTTTTQTVVTATNGTSISVLDAVGAATTNDSWTVKVNKYSPVQGTATSSTVVGSGPSNTSFAVGDLVELYNSTDAEKAQTTVTAVDGSTITVAAGTASQSDGDTVYVAKLSNSGISTQYFDGIIDEAFVTAHSLSGTQVRSMYLAGFSALQNHTANRITGITGADSYQQLAGGGASAATVNKVTAVAVDDQNQHLYVGTNDVSTNIGGVSVLGVHSDTLLDLYDSTNNTTKDDDSGTQFAENDVVALSIHGGDPKYLVIAGTNDSTTKLWLENSDTSLKTHMATATDPHGSTLNQTNLNVTNLLSLGSLGQVNLSAAGKDLVVDSGLQVTGNALFHGSILPNSSVPSFRYLTTGSATWLAGQYNSMVLGADDLPRFVTYDSYLANLYYIRCLNSTCTSYVIQELDDGDPLTEVDNVGYASVIRLGPNNLPYIAYINTSRQGITYIRCLDQNCSSRIKRSIDEEGDLYMGANYKHLDMEVSSKGTPVFAYFDVTNLRIRVATCSDLNCDQTTVRFLSEASATGIGLGYIALALDSNDNPILAYQEWSAYDLWVTACSTPDCSVYSTTEDVVSANSVGWDLSIAIGTDDYPRIVYHDITATDKYVLIKCSTSNCSSSTSTTIDSDVDTSQGQIGSSSSLVMDSSNNSYVAYYDDTNNRLKFAILDDSATPVVTTGPTIVDDPSDDVGEVPSIALTSAGVPIMIYRNVTQTGVRLSTCASSTDCSDANAVTNDIFSHFSQNDAESSPALDMALGNDNMARVVYQDANSGDLRFIRCLDLECSGFVTTNVDSTDDVGDFPAIAIAPDGYARIAYFDDTNNTLKYAQCTNDDCSSSNITEVNVDNLYVSINTTTGADNELVIGKDGYARIVTQGDTERNLIFIRCLNDACTSFHANEILDATVDNTWSETSLALDPNDFAIIFTTWPNRSTAGETAWYNHCSDLDCNKTDTGALGTQIGSTGIEVQNPRVIWNPTVNAPLLVYGYAAGTPVTVATVCTDFKTCAVYDLNTIDSNTSWDIYGVGIDPQSKLPIIIGSDAANSIHIKHCSDPYCGGSTTVDVRIDIGVYKTGTFEEGDALIRQVNGQTQYVVAVNANGAIRMVVADATTDLGSNEHPFAAVFANQFFGQSTSISNFDLAEDYPSVEPLGPGDVVSFDLNSAKTVRKASSPYDPRLAGVVSTQPGIRLYDYQSDQKTYPIALAGRVPTKIDPDSPPIQIGDFLTSSSRAGYATKAVRAGYALGKALENWSCEEDSCPEKIEVFVENGYADPGAGLTSEGNLDIIINDSFADGSNSSASGALNKYALVDQAGRTIENFGVFSKIITANIRAGVLEVNEVASKVVESQQIISPIVETELISPLAGSDVVIDLDNSPSASESGFGKLVVKGVDKKDVAVIDSQGNASFSGTVAADALQAHELTVDKIYADEIVSRKGQFGELASASSSGITREEIEDLLRQAEEERSLFAESMNWELNTATDSASLDNLAVNSLLVTEFASMNSLSLTGSLTLGPDLIISSSGLANQGEEVALNSIDTLSEPLRLQSLALAPVEIMAGKIRIETNGDVTISGNLQVAGQIEAGGLTLKADDLETDPLATQSGLANLLNFLDSEGQPIARVNASGSAQFKELATDKLIIAGSEATTSANLLEGLVTETNATAGHAVIPAGTREITIKNPKITDYTLAYVSPTSSTLNNVLYVKSKQSGMFTVGFNQTLSIPVEFNWWIIDVSLPNQNLEGVQN